MSFHTCITHIWLLPKFGMLSWKLKGTNRKCHKLIIGKLLWNFALVWLSIETGKNERKHSYGNPIIDLSALHCSGSKLLPSGSQCDILRQRNDAEVKKLEYVVVRF